MSENGKLPAYPVSDIGVHGNFGMTKREAFAMAAMQGIAASEQDDHANWADKARGAVALADALLAELAKEPA